LQTDLHCQSRAVVSIRLRLLDRRRLPGLVWTALQL